MFSTGRICLCLILTLVFVGASKAQKRPQALLQVDSAASPDKRYYIDILTDMPLKQSEYDALSGAKPPLLGVLASKGIPVMSAGVGRIVTADDGDRRHFRIYLDEATQPLQDFADKKFTVILTNFKVDGSDDPQIRGIQVGRVLTRAIVTNNPVCRPQQLSMRFDYDVKDQYSRFRAHALYEALNTLKQNATQLSGIGIRVEPLTTRTVSTLTVTALQLNPDKEEALDFNSTLSACLETDKDLPGEKFDAELTWNTPVPPEFVEPRIIEGIEGRTTEASPSVFVDKEKEVGLRPIEKDLNVAVALVSGVEDKEQEDKSIRRERTTRGTLDLRVGLLRNVVKLGVKLPMSGDTPDTLNPIKICGRVNSFTPETPAAQGMIVINGVKWLLEHGIVLNNVQPGTDQCIHFLYSDGDAQGNSVLVTHNTFHPADPVFIPFVGPLERPDVTRGTYSVFTPFYIDAKVSTGKIEKETISLNRVVFGFQEEFRYFANNFRFPTYYRFMLQGNHASDRDFKQKEYKATFEFRPVFGALNHPFDPTNTSRADRVLCQSCDQPFKLIPSTRGFEFVPVIGAEIGRTYSRRNPAADIEPSDTVKRLYLGLDAVWNPTARIALKATEQFYIRGESKADRYHNYFAGEFSYHLASFFQGRAAHSVFFSWEKGGQPPFADPDVNVLKVGYRVTAATLFSR